eukprot:scaffold2336_cov267-Pinguiococcus_pyrenoidosus.AAC.2
MLPLRAVFPLLATTRRKDCLDMGTLRREAPQPRKTAVRGLRHAGAPTPFCRIRLRAERTSTRSGSSAAPSADGPFTSMSMLAAAEKTEVPRPCAALRLTQLSLPRAARPGRLRKANRAVERRS